MRIHFSGIGGIGISGLAQLCQARGDSVQGSDRNQTEIWSILKSLNIKLFTKQTAENISADLDLVIYSEAVPVDNPELIQARELNIPIKTYFEYLGEISQNYTTIAIAGTHGKTTTTGLTAAGCLAADFPATILVGSTLAEFKGANFLAGTNNFLIVEACEYRENFQFLHPDIVVITSLEWDHPDSFPTESAYLTAFRKLVNKAKSVIYHEDEPLIANILDQFTGQKIAIPQQSENSLAYLISIFGRFNERNALLSLALAKKIGIQEEKFKQGVFSYQGAGRRQEFLGTHNGIKFFDDYAHHPTEVTALLQAFRQKFPTAKLGLIYEPHQHSRTIEFFDAFLTSFSYADTVGLLPIYAARDNEADRQFGIENFIEHNSSLQLIKNSQDLQTFCNNFTKNDIIIFCGAGNVSSIGRNFLASC